jgi:hypothetical protein
MIQIMELQAARAISIKVGLNSPPRFYQAERFWLQAAASVEDPEAQSYTIQSTEHGDQPET